MQLRCKYCGAEFAGEYGTIACPDCAHEAIRQKDRLKSKAWNAENIGPEQRNADRHAARAQIPCRVCGKLFVPSHTGVTCSPQCASEYRKARTSAYGKANKDAINQRKRKQAQEKIAAMTPEEYRAYREAVNAQYRKNYQKRQERLKANPDEYKASRDAVNARARENYRKKKENAK